MSLRLRFGSAGLLAVLAACVMGGDLAADGDANPTRPFRGVASGVVAATDQPGEFIIEATGVATHLGKFTREERLTVSPDLTFGGLMIFTAANGDELRAPVTGQFTSPTTASGTYVFVGGTGRFADASGEAEFEAVTNEAQTLLEVSFDGNLRY